MSKNVDMVVYVVTNSVNGKQYVGQTKYGAEFRWKQHVQAANRGQGHVLGNAIRKYGAENFKIEVAVRCESIDELWKHETRLIEELKTIECGYNREKGGWGNPYHPTREETRKKMSAVRKGKKLSEETKRKISQKLQGCQNARGHRVTEEMKQHYREVNSQYRHTDDARRRIVETSAHRWSDPEYKARVSAVISIAKSRPVVMLSDDGTFIQRFDSVRCASESTGVKQALINNCLRHGVRTRLGDGWVRFANCGQ